MLHKGSYRLSLISTNLCLIQPFHFASGNHQHSPGQNYFVKVIALEKTVGNLSKGLGGVWEWRV